MKCHDNDDVKFVFSFTLWSTKLTLTVNTPYKGTVTVSKVKAVSRSLNLDLAAIFGLD
jgi:hypothetical protein